MLELLNGMLNISIDENWSDGARILLLGASCEGDKSVWRGTLFLSLLAPSRKSRQIIILSATKVVKVG